MPKNESFVRHTVIYGLGAFSLQLVSLMLLPLHTRYLTASEYGLLQLFLRVGEVLNILLMFQGIGLATLNVFKLPDQDESRTHIAASATIFLVGVVCLGGVMAFAFAGPVAEFLGIPGRENVLICGVLCLLAEATITMPVTLMQARLESTSYVVTMFGIAALRSLLTLLLVVGMGMGLWGVLLALGASYATFGVVCSIREMANSSFVPALFQVRGITRYALPFIPTGICFFIIQSGDQFLLSKYASLEELGHYGFGNQIARLGRMVALMPIFKVWQTWRYKAYEYARRADLFGEALTRIAFLYLLVALGLLCFRDEVASLLGSSAYEPAKAIIGPLLLAHFFMGAANFFDAPFHIRKRTDLKPWISLASTVVICLLYFAWIPVYGGIGAAFATLFGMLFHAVATFTVAQRVMWIRMEWSRVGWLLLTALPCGCLMIALSGSLLWLPVRVVALFLIPASFWRAGLISPAEKQHVRDTVFAVGRKLGWSLQASVEPCTYNRIRILTLTSNVGFGGSENRIRAFATSLDRTKFDLLVATINEPHIESERELGSLRDEYRKAGISLVSLGATVRKKRLLAWRPDHIVRKAVEFVRLLLRLRRLVRENRIHVIDAHCQEPAFFAFCVSFLCRVRLVATLYHAGESRLAYWSGKVFLSRVDAIITDSNVRKGDLENWVAGSPVVHMIYNGVSPPESDLTTETIRYELGLDGQSPSLVIAQIARLVPFKGQATLLHAAQRVLYKYPDVFFLIVGHAAAHDSFCDELKLLAEKLGVSDQVYIGGYNGAVGDVWRVVDMHVHASHFDSMPNAILEGMSYGKPAVVTDVGGVAEMVLHEQTGLVVSSGDIDGLATSIIRLIEDPALSERLGEAAYERFQQTCRPDLIARQIEAALTQAVVGVDARDLDAKSSHRPAELNAEAKVVW